MEVDLLGVGDAIAAAGIEEVAWAAMHVIVADVFNEQERALADLALDIALYTFLQILSVHSFEKIPILQAFSDGDHRPAASPLPNQLNPLNT